MYRLEPEDTKNEEDKRFCEMFKDFIMIFFIFTSSNIAIITIAPVRDNVNDRLCFYIQINSPQTTMKI
jgi:hypothetical protein